MEDFRIMLSQERNKPKDRIAPPMRRHVEANTLGRDFIMGDLHGCYDQLTEKLKLVSFDTTCDRLFSVGDLIDRGPDSLKCLMLINEPWFHSVLGNHEAMMLQYLGLRSNHYTSAKDFVYNGGWWFDKLSEEDKYTVFELAKKKVMDIPLRLTVKHPAGDFDVVHAQYYTTHPLKDSLEYSEPIETVMTWGRSLFSHVHRTADPEKRRELTELHYAGIKKLVSIEPVMVNRRLTYVGHTIVRTPIKSRSHVFLDTGAYEGDTNKYRSLTMIEHGTQQLY